MSCPCLLELPTRQQLLLDAVSQQNSVPCSGKTLSIFGAGSLGLSAIATGTSLGASAIVAVDVSVAASKFLE